MYVDYQKICEERYIVDRDPTNGRSLRNIDRRSLKLGLALWALAFLLAPCLFVALFYIYFHFFDAHGMFMFNGLDEAFVGWLHEHGLK